MMNFTGKSQSKFDDLEVPPFQKTYPPVNSHRPCQIGVGRLVSTMNWSFSGSTFKKTGGYIYVFILVF